MVLDILVFMVLVLSLNVLFMLVDLFINNVHLKDSGRVVGEQTTVKEELGQCQVYHPVILFDDGFHSIVHQRDVLVRKVEEHPLRKQQTQFIYGLYKNYIR